MTAQFLLRKISRRHSRHRSCWRSCPRSCRPAIWVRWSCGNYYEAACAASPFRRNVRTTNLTEPCWSTLMPYSRSRSALRLSIGRRRSGTAIIDSKVYNTVGFRSLDRRSCRIPQNASISLYLPEQRWKHSAVSPFCQHCCNLPLQRQIELPILMLSAAASQI